MLAKQKIIEEAGCSLLREQIPGQGDQQGEQESPEPRKTWEYQSGLTRLNRPEARGQQDENQCNRSLGQQAQGKTDKEQPSFTSPFLLFSIGRQPEGSHGDRDGQAEGHVGHYRPRRCQEHQRTPKQGKGDHAFPA